TISPSPGPRPRRTGSRCGRVPSPATGRTRAARSSFCRTTCPTWRCTRETETSRSDPSSASRAAHGDGARALEGRRRIERRQREHEPLDARERVDDGALGAELVEGFVVDDDEEV